MRIPVCQKCRAWYLHMHCLTEKKSQAKKLPSLPSATQGHGRLSMETQTSYSEESDSTVS